MSKAIIPSTITTKDLAEETGWSERFIREKARALNACLGRNRGMRLTQEDVLKIMEARRCPSRSKSAAKYTTTQARFPAGDYEALQGQRTDSGRKKLQPRSTTQSGNVVTMDRSQS